MERKTCCVIGYLDIPADMLKNVKWELEREVKAALEDGYTVFITEFTEGAGMLFARIIGGLREKYPGVFWETILSRIDQAEAFSRETWELLTKSDGVKPLCADCRKEYPLSVTRYMVEQSSRIIAVCAANDDSDTYYAIDYAGIMGRDVRSIQLY